jgi:NitT/TauT family transport system substrate-binding protein
MAVRQRASSVRGLSSHWLPVYASALLGVAVLSINCCRANAQTKIEAGIVSHGTSQWPQYVAEELGWFKRDGLSLEMVSVGSGTAQQLAASAINIAHSGFPEFVRAANQGAHVRIIINDISVPPYTVYARASIKAVGELRGKTISIGGVKDVTLIYIRPLLASAGLSDKDVDFVFAKAAGDRFSALAGGAVDAAILNPPASFRAADLGFTSLGEIANYTREFPFTMWAVNTDWAARNKDALIAFSKIHLDAVRWLYEASHKDKAIDILLKYAKQSRKDASDSYDYYFRTLQGFSRDGLLPNAAYQKMTEGMIALGDLAPPIPPVSKFFDESFITLAAVAKP